MKFLIYAESTTRQIFGMADHVQKLTQCGGLRKQYLILICLKIQQKVGKLNAAFQHSFLKTIYKHKYHILEPFRLVGRKLCWITALTHVCRCIFCNKILKDLLDHQLFSCQGLSKESHTLLSAVEISIGRKLTDMQIRDKHNVMSAGLSSRSTLEAFADLRSIILRFLPCPGANYIQCRSFNPRNHLN